MSDEGYIKLYRSLLEWEWWSDINVHRLFTYLLLSANYSDKKWQGQVIERGTLVTSISKLSSATGLSIRQVRTALEKLQGSGEVLTKSGQGAKHTIIRVCNYDKYQGRQSFDEVMTNQRQSNDKVATTTKEYKEYKNKRNNNIYIVEQKKIVDYLNNKIGTKYKHTAQTTQRNIRARLNEGYTVDDFIKVIDNKSSQWLSDEKMKQYLRPETLFCAKHFESYLNEQPTGQKQSKYEDLSHIDKETQDNLKGFVYNGEFM